MRSHNCKPVSVCPTASGCQAAPGPRRSVRAAAQEVRRLWHRHSARGREMGFCNRGERMASSKRRRGSMCVRRSRCGVGGNIDQHVIGTARNSGLDHDRNLRLSPPQSFQPQSGKIFRSHLDHFYSAVDTANVTNGI